MKEAAVQRRHNLYRDSIVLTNSDPNLHLLGENPSVDWATKFGGDEPDSSGVGMIEGGGSGKRRRQVVSMIQLDGVPLPYESCLEVPGVELIPEENVEVFDKNMEYQEEEEENEELPKEPMSPDSVNEIRDLINPIVEMALPVTEEEQSDVTNGTQPTRGILTSEDGVQEEVTHVTTIVEDVPRGSVRDKTSPHAMLRQLAGSRKEKADKEALEEVAIENATEEIPLAAQEGDSGLIAEITAADSDLESTPLPTDSSLRDDSGFQSPTNVEAEDSEPRPITNGLSGEDKVIDPVDVELILV